MRGTSRTANGGTQDAGPTFQKFGWSVDIITKAITLLPKEAMKHVVRTNSVGILRFSSPYLASDFNLWLACGGRSEFFGLIQGD